MLMERVLQTLVQLSSPPHSQSMLCCVSAALHWLLLWVVTSCLVHGLNKGWKRLTGLEEELVSCRQSWLLSFVLL